MAVTTFREVVKVKSFKLFKISQLSISSAHFSYSTLSSSAVMVVSGKEPPP